MKYEINNEKHRVDTTIILVLQSNYFRYSTRVIVIMTPETTVEFETNWGDPPPAKGSLPLTLTWATGRRKIPGYPGTFSYLENHTGTTPIQILDPHARLAHAQKCLD